LPPILHRCRQMVRAMLLGHAANLPERFFDSFSKRFKRFTQTDGDRFHVGVGEHKMMDHVGKGNTSKRDAQILHMGKIRLSSLTREMLLCKHDLAIWSM